MEQRPAARPSSGPLSRPAGDRRTKLVRRPAKAGDNVVFTYVCCMVYLLPNESILFKSYSKVALPCKEVCGAAGPTSSALPTLAATQSANALLRHQGGLGMCVLTPGMQRDTTTGTMRAQPCEAPAELHGPRMTPRPRNTVPTKFQRSPQPTQRAGPTPLHPSQACCRS